MDRPAGADSAGCVLEGVVVLLLVLQIVGALVLLDLLVQSGFAGSIIPHFERKPKLRARVYPPVKGLETLAVLTPNGHTLRGNILYAGSSSPAGVIIFCHEFGGSRWSYRGHCADDVIADHDLVTFDFRNHGESDHDDGYLPSHWLTRFELLDVLAIVDWVRSQPAWRDAPITLMGVSRGANAALAAAAERDIAGVIAIGAFATHRLAMHHLMAGIRRSIPAILAVPRWHIRSTLNLAIAWSGLRQRVRFVRIERAAARLNNRPVLLIAGGDDSHIPESFQKSLAARIPGAEFWTVPGGRHNLERDAAPQEFDERLSAFLDRVSQRPSIARPSGKQRLKAA